MKHKEVTIPTLLGLFVAILGLGSGLFLLNGQVRLNSQAAADEQPSEVKVTNISDNSFVASWFTQKAVSGYVQYGEFGQETDLVVSDERDQQKGEVGNYFTHLVTIRGLKPSTRYIFRVGSGRSIYDNQGQAYQVTTASTLTNPPAADVAYGMVVTQNSEPADGAIVYLDMLGAAPQAALVKASGSWVVPLATSRSTDLSAFVSYDKNTTPITLTVQGGMMGKSVVKTNSGDDSPVAQISLGVDSGTGQDEVVVSSPDTQLKILTPRVGESVNTESIEITGQAPAGVEVSVEIHSDEVVMGKVVANSDGTFMFDVPTNLSPGQHTITITALINGVVEKITRSFTVYAAEESGLPFYTATPSATLIPSPTIALIVTPTTSLIPTATPIVTKSPTPTLPPRVVNPSTESAIPIVGTDWITWLLLGAGVILLSGGVVWYRKIS